MLINPTILILDGGATSLAQKVARAVRALGVFTLIAPANKPGLDLEGLEPAAMILIKGAVPLAAELMERVDLVLRGDDPAADLTGPTEENPTWYWDKPDLSDSVIAGLAGFLRAKNLDRTFTPKLILPSLIETTQNLVGDRKVLLALSGGVDSTVCAALIHRAVGSGLKSVFVDHGLIRAGEAEEVAAMAKGDEALNLSMLDRRRLFLEALAQVSDPEEKRKIIGRIFIEVFEEEARRHADLTFLGQGTIYPDIIESVCSVNGGPPVKSHHNVGGLPERLNLTLLEPLKYFFKDEVRALGLELGLSPDLVFRQPFPGPGLGVRCVGEVTEEKLSLLRAADLIVRSEIAAAGLKRKPWQYFAIILPVQSVGVRNHARVCGFPCVIRAIETVDAMTAKPSDLPWPLLTKMADRIMAEVPGISRVLYDLSAKPTATIEWE